MTGITYDRKSPAFFSFSAAESREYPTFVHMDQKVYIYNSLAREKQLFEPLVEGYIGYYVCGPTVYSDVHLGNCRTFTSFDVIYRYLSHIGYKVRYVRNITDVGHLEGDADSGAEDKISKKARLEKLEPMEIAQKYTLGFHEMMGVFNNISPNIEPRATGHIIEQIEMVQKIIDNGYAYKVNGSVYFDTIKFAKENEVYGKLSGRVMDDLMSETRELKNQDEKRHPSDFAIWIKADPSHLMQWNSPWSRGFPGWHLECSAMSTKYLGETFDIHGGGSDLKFPHHENEIAQNYGACSCQPANYWMHANMLLMNGRKMSKSDGNTITPTQLFTGNNKHVSKGYSPMVVRFFMLQSHYRSTLDLTDDALAGAEKGYRRLMAACQALEQLEALDSGQASEHDTALENGMNQIYEEMNDDFNTPRALARVFELVQIINKLHNGQIDLSAIRPETLERLKKEVPLFVFDIFGLRDETTDEGEEEILDRVMQVVIELRSKARADKNYDMADLIRDRLNENHITLKDSKEGTQWSIEK
jgi:cysteinyl-tRNA synthetase